MNQDKPVLISYPCPDMVHADFTQALCMMIAYSIAVPKIWLGVSQTRGSIICATRNMQVRQAIDQPGGVSHILFLDSDMIFPANTLERLLSHNLPVVGTTYCQRRSPRTLTHRDLNFASRFPDLPIFPVLTMGMGCVLVNMEVITAMTEQDPLAPWFQVEYHGREHHTGEDGHFFRRINQCGFSVYCDGELSRKVFHVGTHAYGIDDVEKEYDGSEPRFDHDSVPLPALGDL